MTSTPGSVRSFYRAAVAAARALEVRTGRARWFGPDADATWRAFRGELVDGDRIDLILRDAAAAHPLAFAPRAVFGLGGLTEDEPFGPEWAGPDPSSVMGLLRGDPDAGVEQALATVARVWRLEPVAPPSGAVSAVGPASRVIAAGAGAVVGLALHAADRREMDLGDQILLVSDVPGERQLFGVAVALLGGTHAARTAGPRASADDLRANDFPRADLVIVSEDAPAEPRAAAYRLGEELGG